MEGRVLFDLSTYMLFEESGDSDAQCFHHMDYSDANTAAEDDAQSCSYESVCEYSARLREVVDRGGDIDLRGEEEEEEEEGGGEEDGVVDQRRRRLFGTAAEKPAKYKGCEDSNAKKMMNERERDRQFWEACLAS